MADVLAQVLDPPLRRGEDATVTITGTFAASPAAWTTRFTLAPAPGAAPALAVAGPAPTVTGSGPVQATWLVGLSDAQSLALAAGTHHWEFARVDADRVVVAAGTWAVLDSVTAHP